MQNSLIRLSAMIAHQFGIERAPAQSIKMSADRVVCGNLELNAYFLETVKIIEHYYLYETDICLLGFTTFM